MSNDRWIACFACILFTFIAFTSQVFIFWPWLFGTVDYSSSTGYHSEPSVEDPLRQDDGGLATGVEEGYLSLMWSNLNVRAILYLVPFNISLGMLCWNYYLTMITDPGSPPVDWTPPIDGSSIEYKKTTHTPRYCRSCDTYKPPRTHHCRTCKKCVLKMDHHCPWVQNCVGFKNYGHFVRFITWTTIATFICASLLILRIMEAYDNEQLGINRHNAPSQQQILLIVVNMVLDGSVFIGISILTTYHYWCISSNTTTIESWEKDRVLTMIRRGKIRDVKCPYHQGFLANFQDVLGQNPLLWLWPQPMIGDGLVFKVKKDKNEDYDSSHSDDDLTSTSTSRSQHSRTWFRPFDGTNEPQQQHRDSALEMV